MDEIDRIVAGLSEAQKRVIEHLDQSGRPTQLRSGIVAAALVRRLGLALPSGDWNARGRQYSLTETGLAVRARLLQEGK